MELGGPVPPLLFLFCMDHRISRERGSTCAVQYALAQSLDENGVALDLLSHYYHPKNGWHHTGC
jgi:hypothetical protein